MTRTGRSFENVSSVCKSCLQGVPSAYVQKEQQCADESQERPPVTIFKERTDFEIFKGRTPARRSSLQDRIEAAYLPLKPDLIYISPFTNHQQQPMIIMMIQFGRKASSWLAQSAQPAQPAQHEPHRTQEHQPANKFPSTFRSASLSGQMKRKREYEEREYERNSRRRRLPALSANCLKLNGSRLFLVSSFSLVKSTLNFKNVRRHFRCPCVTVAARMAVMLDDEQRMSASKSAGSLSSLTLCAAEAPYDTPLAK